MSTRTNLGLVGMRRTGTHHFSVLCESWDAEESRPDRLAGLAAGPCREIGGAFRQALEQERFTSRARKLHVDMVEDGNVTVVDSGGAFSTIPVCGAVAAVPSARSGRKL